MVIRVGKKRPGFDARLIAVTAVRTGEEFANIVLVPLDQELVLRALLLAVANFMQRMEMLGGDCNSGMIKGFIGSLIGFSFSADYKTHPMERGETIFNRVLCSGEQTQIMKFVYRFSLLASIAMTCDNLPAATTFQTVGDALQIVLPASAAGMAIYYKDGQGAVQLSKSLITTMGLTYALKYTVNEVRPNGGAHSFPSGHTSSSFAAAEFIRKRYGWDYGVPAYALATVVGYSRVESNQHYTRDVLAGATIGILSSYFFTEPYQGWNVGIEGDSKGAGIKFTRKF